MIHLSVLVRGMEPGPRVLSRTVGNTLVGKHMVNVRSIRTADEANATDIDAHQDAGKDSVRT